MCVAFPRTRAIAILIGIRTRVLPTSNIEQWDTAIAKDVRIGGIAKTLSLWAIFAIFDNRL